MREAVLLTTDEAAAVLRIHPGTVRVNCRAGVLACVRTGAGSHVRWRIPRQALGAFIGNPSAPHPANRPAAFRADDV